MSNTDFLNIYVHVFFLVYVCIYHYLIINSWTLRVFPPCLLFINLYCSDSLFSIYVLNWNFLMQTLLKNIFSPSIALHRSCYYFCILDFREPVIFFCVNLCFILTFTSFLVFLAFGPAWINTFNAVEHFHFYVGEKKENEVDTIFNKYKVLIRFHVGVHFQLLVSFLTFLLFSQFIKVNIKKTKLSHDILSRSVSS